MKNLINCGLCRVQKQGRVSIKDIIDKEKINIGDYVEVFIIKEKKKEV